MGTFSAIIRRTAEEKGVSLFSFIYLWTHGILCLTKIECNVAKYCIVGKNGKNIVQWVDAWICQSLKSVFFWKIFFTQKNIKMLIFSLWVHWRPKLKFSIGHILCQGVQRQKYKKLQIRFCLEQKLNRVRPGPIVLSTLWPILFEFRGRSKKRLSYGIWHLAYPYRLKEFVI